MINMAIGELINKATSQYSRLPAFQQGERTVTFSTLGESINRFANALLDFGIRPGDRVGIWTRNCIEYVIADFSLAKLGAVKVPMNHFLAPAEVEYRILDAGVGVLVIDSEFLETAKELAERTQLALTFIVANGFVSDTSKNVRDFAGFMERGSPAEPRAVVRCDDLCAIMYTGGTTTRSKGVMHTHASMIALGFSAISELEIDRGGTILHVGPLPHGAGLLLLPGLLRGNKQILLSGFDPEGFLTAIQEHAVTFTLLVPTQIYQLLDCPSRDSFDLSSLRTLVYGSAPMAPARLKQALAVWGPKFIQLYAQMEAALQATVLTKQDHVELARVDEGRLATCGRPVTMVQIKLTDDDGIEVPNGEVGEILIRGPHVMRGYWNMPDETAKAVRDGWLHTGDLGRRDEDGLIFVVDRKKDMIISGGFNVYSAVVEKVLFEHPAIRQAAVIGVPDAKWGEQVKAIVVLHNEQAASVESILQHCKERLSRYEVPKSVEFASDLPLTAYGKISKKDLRAQYWKGKDRQVN